MRTVLKKNAYEEFISAYENLEKAMKPRIRLRIGRVFDSLERMTALVERRDSWESVRTCSSS